MHVTRVSSSEQLRELCGSWNCLTRGVPFRSWQWLATWWEHYGGAARELYVLAVYDGGGELVGVAPWYAENMGSRGRTLRFLGSGEVCSDYLSVFSTHEHQESVTDAMVAWLVAAAEPHSIRDPGDVWELIELDNVSDNDSAVSQLVAGLSEAGCPLHRHAGPACWRIELPTTWEEYVARFSKSRRRKIRKLETLVREKGVSLRVAQNAEERAQAMETLVRLHQERRRSLGEPGCFASEAFAGFLHDVVQALGPPGSLQLSCVEQGGRPIAAEIYLTGASTNYMYQSGIDSDALDLQPGHLSNLLLIRRAIEHSQQSVDFLRGDEPYKASWGAQAVPTCNIRVSANRFAPQIRHGVWVAGLTVKNWIKSGITLTGMN